MQVFGDILFLKDALLDHFGNQWGDVLLEALDEAIAAGSFEDGLNQFFLVAQVVDGVGKKMLVVQNVLVGKVMRLLLA